MSVADLPDPRVQHPAQDGPFDDADRTSTSVKWSPARRSRKTRYPRAYEATVASDSGRWPIRRAGELVSEGDQRWCVAPHHQQRRNADEQKSRCRSRTYYQRRTTDRYRRRPLQLRASSPGQALTFRVLRMPRHLIRRLPGRAACYMAQLHLHSDLRLSPHPPAVPARPRDLLASPAVLGVSGSAVPRARTRHLRGSVLTSAFAPKRHEPRDELRQARRLRCQQVVPLLLLDLTLPLRLPG